jgi:hypothetical protein
LAAKGLRFTQFYNTAKCHSSRARACSPVFGASSPAGPVWPALSPSRRCWGRPAISRP